MPRAVRTISVNLSAGTAQFMADMEKASGKVREFGREGVTNVQATSGALRVSREHDEQSARCGAIRC